MVPTSTPSSTEYSTISGTLIVFLKAMTRPTASPPNIPASSSGRLRLGLPATVNQEAAPTRMTIEKSPRVFMTTSSRVTRPICTGPADGWLYRSWS